MEELKFNDEIKARFKNTTIESVYDDYKEMLRDAKKYHQAGNDIGRNAMLLAIKEKIEKFLMDEKT